MACGIEASRRSRSPRPSAIRMRVAFGESWMPAPVSCNCSACSSSVTRKPLRASISAALKPPMPAPAMTMVRDDATARAFVRLRGYGPGAGFRTRRMRIELRIVAVERRAVGADDLALFADVQVYMGMIEWRLGADAHELPCSDLDDGDTNVVMEMRNDVIGHDSVRGWMTRRTIATLSAYS